MPFRLFRGLALIAFQFVLAQAAHCASVILADLQGAISPASVAYFERVLEQARGKESELVILKLDTPGGLDTSMRRMVQDILASEVPVAVYVFPSGARAASAGTYLLYASHVAAMAPGTNLGAATPVPIGIGGPQAPPAQPEEGAKKPGSTMQDKAMHDAAAYLRSLAQLRGRNAEWAAQAVTDAASLSAHEALELKVIDLIADDVPDLMRRLDGREIAVAGGSTRVLALAGAELVEVERNWHERLLATLSDPNVSLILLMVGVYGLLIEFYTPGMGAPGVLGGICLLLALYGLALLPINYVGFGLILLGVALMVAEAFVPSFGVLGIGGLTAFVAGALMLIDADVPGLALSWHLLLPFVLASSVAFGAVGWLALRARRRPPVSGAQAMLGASVEALENIAGNGTGWVLAGGERWQARCTLPIAKGERAKIVAIEGLMLHLQPMGRNDSQQAKGEER